MKSFVPLIPSNLGFVCACCKTVTRDEPSVLGESFNWLEGCRDCSDKINNQEENN